MLAVQWLTRDVGVDRNTERQTCEQIELPLLRLDGLNGQVNNVPLSSESRSLREDLLAGLCRAFGDD